MRDKNHVKVCYLVESFYPVLGGGETSSMLTTQHFSKDADEVVVLTRHTIVDTKKHERLFGARVIRIPPSGGTAEKGRWLMVITAMWWLVKERKNYNIIFVDGFRALGISAVLIGKIFGKRTVFKAQCMGELSGAFFDQKLRKLKLSRDRGIGKLIVNTIISFLKRADAYCPQTTDIQKETLDAGVPQEKVHIIPNSYDISRFAPASAQEKSVLRQNFAISEDRVVGVFTGRLVSYKGPEILARAWAEIVSKSDVQPLLLIVGPDGTEASDCGPVIRRFINDNQLEKCIVTTGGVNNVEDFLRVADFFIFPSLTGEGCSISIIEAMACGLPVITTYTPGMTDLVTDETGILIEPGNNNALKEAIIKILTEPNTRQRKGAAAARTALSQYSPQTVTAEYIKIFKNLVGREDNLS